MQKYFRQGLAYLVNIYTSHYDSLIKFRYFTHEIVLLAELLIQSFYLIRKKATYSEYFFGFRRSVIDPNTRSLKPLTKLHIVFSLFFEVVLPYLKHKVNQAFEEQEWLKERTTLKKVFKCLSYLSETSLFVF